MNKELGIVYMRMYVSSEGNVYALAIMNDNDILQTKYVAGLPWHDINIGSPIGNLLHTIIKNVTKHMGTKHDDAIMDMDLTSITIGSGSDSSSHGTWTSTIWSDNETVELDCKVVEVNGSIVTATCGPDRWSESVFNRIPIWINSGAQFGYDSTTNRVLFGTQSFSYKGSVPSVWNESIQYDVTGHESDLTIGGQLTIMGQPESFVNHWVNTIHAKAYMGDDYVMLVPPGT